MFRNPMMIVALVALATIAGTARATVFCVGSADGFRHALQVASMNENDNTIKVRTGTYVATTGGFSYFHDSGNKKLLIEGGWNAGCTRQTKDASLTVIDGGDEHPLLNLYNSDPSSGADIIVRYFDLSDGISESGTSPVDIETFGGDARIENCRIRHNFALSSNTEIVRLASYDADVYFLDNVVADNTARDSPMLMYFTAEVHAFINDNTITANLFGTSADSVDGLILTNRGDFANNIIWDNTAWLPEIWSAFAPVLDDNDIDFVGVPVDPSSHGNIAADPRFVSASNRRLRADSPACGAGDDSPPGTTRTVDLDGNPRVVFTIDMGAYERQGTCH